MSEGKFFKYGKRDLVEFKLKPEAPHPDFPEVMLRGYVGDCYAAWGKPMYIVGVRDKSGTPGAELHLPEEYLTLISVSEKKSLA